MKTTTRYFASITILLMAMYGTAFAQTPDTEPPSTPTGLQVIETHNTAIGISWEASTDNVGVAGYFIYANDLLQGSSVDNEYILTELSANTPYIITVSAFDAVSNLSQQSEPITPVTSTSGITGHVIWLGDPMSTAVYLSGNGISTTTTTDVGVYYFPDLKAGIYNLRVGTLTYIVEVSDNRLVVQNFDLGSNLPVVHTEFVSSITETTAQCGGSVTGSDIESKGVVWRTTPDIFSLNPDTTLNGLGSGTFTSFITGLTQNTTYYVKAYARNSDGLYFWGEEYSFYTGCNTIIFNEGINQITCYGESDGEISITHMPLSDPFPYSWTGPNTFTDATSEISMLEAGVYELTYTDQNGCQTVKSYAITEPPAIQILVDNIRHESDPGASDGAISITPLGGNPPFTYAWTGTGPFSSTVEDITDLVTGTYTVVVTDQNLCSGSLDMEVSNPFIVTNTDDYDPSGDVTIYGSLRFAMDHAGSNPGTDNISFNIPGPGPHKILPLFPLPIIEDPVIIDGYTQTGAIKATSSIPASLMVELDGSALPDNLYNAGLILESGNCVIRGLMINRFGDVGIQIAPPGSNIIEGNYIGSDGSGGLDMGNGYDESNEEGAGIRIYRSNGNIIGGTNVEARNIISNNFKYGILINGSVDNGTIYPAINNQILGNLIGTDKSGTIDMGNEVGIQIDTASQNTIGGLITSERNIISGNNSGIIFRGYNTSENSIIGNYIGTDITGANALGNNWAIYIYSGGNFVGGTETGAGNVISGNTSSGLMIVSSLISDIESSNNKVLGNYIGPNAAGTGTLASDQVGIMIVDAPSNIIGGPTVEERNVISGNRIGLYIGWKGAVGNYVQGNIIGLTVDGSNMLSNSAEGVYINAPGNYIGGTGSGEGNVISGNDLGILLSDTADGNFIQGNLIGTDITGRTSYANAKHGIDLLGGKDNIIGGASKSARNIISGNGENGIYMHFSSHGDTATGNMVKGNFIGLNIEGNKLGNGTDGVRVDTRNNFIGGENPGEGNVISGNGSNGVHIWEKEAIGNQIHGNIIGLDSSGTADIGNASAGVSFNTCVNNTLGGTSEGSRNIISGNEIGVVIQGSESQPEPRLNRVIGNYIGPDITGTDSIGNTYQGIYVGGAQENTIGGSDVRERNIISGNGNFGILLIEASHDNVVKGNFLGTDVNGTAKIPNMIGVHVLGADRNVIGGPELGDGNLISGNEEGILIYANGDYTADENIIQGNLIGTDITGKLPLGNLNGIRIQDYADDNLIGGINPGEGNLIAFNEWGIVCNGPWYPSVGNSFLSNSIHSNSEMGINLYNDISDLETPNDPFDDDAGSNNLQNYPELTGVIFSQNRLEVSGSLHSVPYVEYLIQYFVSPEMDASEYGEGKTYVGSDTVTTTGSGSVTFTASFETLLRDGLVVTATATDVVGGNTSEFSMAIGGAENQSATSNMPMHYVINEQGLPYVEDGSDFQALHNAFDTWEAITTSEVAFIDKGTTSLKKAVANDGINLITFADESFFITDEVLGIAAKTLYMDDTDGTAEIVDADIVFNPFWAQGEDRFSTDTYDGAFDLQSIATHEIGHTFGMIHTGVLESTMFFAILEQDTEKRTLEQDDISWASYRYPGADYNATFGSIAGKIKYGDLDDQPAVGGALVVATNTTTGAAIHSYSDEDGNFLVPGLPSGNYQVAIEPLDGNVHGYNLTDRNISYYIDGITIYTDFPNEYYNGIGEGATNDDPAAFEPVSVTAGVTSTLEYNLVTNKDDTRPGVIVVTPKKDSTGVDVLSQVYMGFTEQVNISTFTDESCYLKLGEEIIFGGFTLADNYGRRIVFTADQYPLEFSSSYVLHITDDVKDLKGNDLIGNNQAQDLYTSLFTTRDKDSIPPIVSDIIPNDGNDTVFINADMMVFFNEPMDAGTTEEGFSLTDEDGAIVEGSYAWREDFEMLTFDPFNNLTEGKAYTVTVDDGLKDLSGNPLEKDSVLTFSTVLEARPEIVFVGPKENQSGVSLESPLVIDFTEPIDPQSTNVNTIKLLKDGIPINGAFDFHFNNSRVVFRTSDLLTANTTYNVVISDQIKDVSDTQLSLEQGMNYNFTTGATITQPSIHYLHPSSGTYGTLVMIGGEGFDPSPANMKVIFNDNEAVILEKREKDLTSIPTIVPNGANPGMVHVEVGILLSNEEYFYVVPDVDHFESEIRRTTSSQSSPQGVHIDPDAGFAYITNSGANTLSRLDMVTFDVITVPVGEMPVQVDLHPNGKMAYVTNYYSHNVSVIDLETFEVIETIPVGINPYGVVVSPNGDQLYVGNSTSEDIMFIDVDPNSGGYDRVVRSVKTNASNKGIDISPDAALVLIACDEGILFLVTDPEHVDYNTINRRVNTGASASSVHILPDAGMGIAVTDDNYLVLIDIVPGDGYGEIRGKVSTKSGISDIAISPDGLFIYATHTETNEISVFQINYTGAPDADASVNVSVELELIKTIKVDEAPYGIAIDPRAEKVLVTHNTEIGQITEIDLGIKVGIFSSLEDLLSLIENLVISGSLHHGNGNALISMLNAVLHQLGNDNVNAASNVLDAFIKKVDNLIKKGKLSSIEGGYLIEQAKIVIAELQAGYKSSEILTGIDEFEAPAEPALGPIFPNPFDQSTTIHYVVSSDDGSTVPVRINVYNSTGQLVANLVEMKMSTGTYSVEWNGRYDDERMVSEGIYYVQMVAGDVQLVEKAVVIR